MSGNWFRSSKAAPTNVKGRPAPLGLKKLYNPDPQECNVDIVFVHGLMGDRERTWTGEADGILWPETLLPEEIPTARILTFGYDAEVIAVTGKVSRSNTANHANKLLTSVATLRDEDDTNERPIVFVCHSLGGLVCEDALVKSNASAAGHLQKIVECTLGVLFLGTPHNGTELAEYAKSLIKPLVIASQANMGLLKVLQRDSEVLARIQDEFHTMLQARRKMEKPDIEITCFFEELATSGVGVVVPERSAVLPGYNSIGIHANHRDMAKFDNENDAGFRAVSGEIRRWVNSSREPRAGHDLHTPIAENTPAFLPHQSQHRVPDQPQHQYSIGSVGDRSVGVISGNVNGGMYFG